MKPISLRYIKEELEINYQQHKAHTHKGVFGRNLLFYASLSFSYSIYSFFLGQWLLGALCQFYCFFIVPFIYIALQKWTKKFDIVCFAFQSAVVSAPPLFIFLKQAHKPLEDVDSYLAGQAITFVLLSFNLGSRFDLKCLAIFINILTQCVVLFQQKKITAITVSWVWTNLIILNYIYWHDRTEREAFLIKHNEKLWQKEIGSCAKLCIMTCESKQGQLLLDYNKCNPITQQEFSIYDLDTFKQLLNKIKLTQKANFSQQILNDMKSQFKSKKFITLHNQIHILSEKTQSVNLEFMGLYSNCVYEVKIFTTWCDQVLNINILLKKSSTQTESENCQRLMFEHKLFAQFRQQIRTSMKTIFSKLRKIDTQKQFKSLHGFLVCDIHNALRISYNIQLFLNPSYSQTRISFFMSPLLDQITSMILYSMPEPLKLTIKSFIDPEMKLISCQKTIFHILFNIFSITVRSAQKSGYIIVTARQKSYKIGECIIFSIATNIQMIQNLIDYQNYQQTLYGENRGFDLNNKKVGLDIMISEYMIGQIGPRRRIKFENLSKDRQIISFSVFKDIDSLMI